MFHQLLGSIHVLAAPLGEVVERQPLLVEELLELGPVLVLGLVRRAAECLRVVAAYASINTGARGDALVRCHLIVKMGPAKLGYARWLDRDVWEQLQPSRQVSGDLVGTPRGIDIDAVLRSPVEWMLATRLVTTDLFHGFGQPEVIQITESGAFNTNHWRPSLLDSWKLVEGVQRVSENIPFR